MSEEENVLHFDPRTSGKKGFRFALKHFRDVRPNGRRPYLVRDIIPRAGLAVVWGEPKCGKSYWTFDLALHVALGWQYRGKKVTQGSVVYCAFEGAEGFNARAEAFRQRFLPDGQDPQLWLMTAPINLGREGKQLIRDIRSQLAGAPTPVLVVLDTLNRSLGGSESSDEDMSAYIQAADALREDFGCTVAIVHHCGKDSTRPRGHTSLTGAADAQLSVRRDGAGNIIVAVEYMKDGPTDGTILSRLEVVEVGIDEDGEPVTACVVLPVEQTEAAAAARPKLPPAAKIAFNALVEAINEVGEVPPASNHIPPSTKAVTIDQWRRYAYRRGICDSDKPRARQAAFQRAMTTLAASKCIGIWEPHAWLAN